MMPTIIREEPFTDTPELQRVLALYEAYDVELRDVARQLRAQYHRMQRQGFQTEFSDVEGELLYLLVREQRPEQIFEVSPAAGWSTNYLLAALSANRQGVLHAFELRPQLRGAPTEAVIRANQCPAWDQQRLVIHVGDARATVPEVPGSINVLLLDSCHDAWFAQWYLQHLLPRVDETVMIQDIAFVDQLESSSAGPSSEAQAVWEWLRHRRMPVMLVGSLEASLERMGTRRGFPERSSRRSNALVLRLPQVGQAPLPELGRSLERLLQEAEEAVSMHAPQVADRLLNEATVQLARAVTRANRHRLFLEAGRGYRRIGEMGEAQRCLERAIGVAMQADRLERCKALAELFGYAVAHGQWRLMMQSGCLVSVEPAAWSALGRYLLRAGHSRFARVVGRRPGRERHA